MSSIQRVVMFLILVSAVAGCAAADKVTCAGFALELYSQPQDTTIAVGASFVATAGARWGGCYGQPIVPPARLMVWSVSDSTIVSLVVPDSIHAIVTGVRPGTTLVTPRYYGDSTGDVSAVHVIVTE